MSSIGSLLSIARTALQTQQAAVAVAGHNIANAQTKGYSRQTLQVSANVPELRPEGAIGTGVVITGVGRAREALLDMQVRSSAASASGAGARRDLLTSVQDVFTAGGDATLDGALDQFYSAWGDLATNPASAAARANVRERGASLATTLNGIATRLDRIATGAKESATALLSQANGLASRIATLNVQIVAGDGLSGSANDLKDERDRLIDSLAEIVPINVVDHPDGSTTIHIGGLAFVDGVDTHPLSVMFGVGFAVSMNGSPDPLRLGEGKLGQTMQVINTDIPAVRTALDALAAGLVADVNAAHVTGWSPTAGAAGNWNPALGPTGSGITFFDVTSAPGSTARGITLSAEVKASANAIASSDTLNAVGNNGVALAIADLRRSAATSAQGDYGTDLRALVRFVATLTRSATDDAEVNGTLRNQAAERRTASSGVSTDEELTGLMKSQQAYIAASKLVNVVDELAKTVLGLIR